MENINNVRVTTLKKSKFLRPFTMEYTQNGKQKSWDVLSVHDGVSVLIFNTTRKVFMFVKQFRPVLFVNKLPKSEQNGDIDVKKFPIENGVTLELCAGIVDKNLPLKQIAAEEIFEECGYLVEADALEKIITYRSGPGRTGSANTLFFCEITDSMKIKGNKKEDLIDVVEMTVEQAKEYLNKPDIESTAVLLFALNWYFINKVNNQA